jgi:hypothetical protein
MESGRQRRAASTPACRCWFLERVEAAAQECEDPLDLRGKLFGRPSFRLRGASVGEEVEGGGERGGDWLRERVVLRSPEILGDRWGDHFRELCDAGAQVTAQGRVAADAAMELLVELAPTMRFVGALVAAVTLTAGVGDSTTALVCRLAAGLLAGMAVLTALTGARTPVA